MRTTTATTPAPLPGWVHPAEWHLRRRTRNRAVTAERVTLASPTTAALRLFVNSAWAGSLARTGAINTTSNPLRIGGNSVWSEWFNGRIDEVRVYNHALTAVEIATDMNTPVADSTPPVVSAVSPTANATGVGLGANATATFSEGLDASTVSTVTFELREPGGGLIPAVVTYDTATRTATLDPTAALTPSTAYTAVLRGGSIKDLAGNPLVADYTWSFTTAPLSLAVSDATVTEGNGGSVDALFTVTLNASSSQQVSMTFATADGTATAGTDYTARAPTVLTFEPGETTKTVAVPVFGDTSGEANETFFLNLTNPTNAILGDAQGLATIVDDDGTLIGSDGYGYQAFTHRSSARPGSRGSRVFAIRATGNNNSDLLTLAAGNTFNFYGTAYSGLYVSTNGLISFGSGNTSASNSNLTSAPTQPTLAAVGRLS